MHAFTKLSKLSIISKEYICIIGYFAVQSDGNNCSKETDIAWVMRNAVQVRDSTVSSILRLTLKLANGVLTCR